MYFNNTDYQLLESMFQLIMVNRGCLMLLSTNLIVDLKSTISQLGRHRVCPKETVLFECFVEGDNLVWSLPGVNQTYMYSKNSNNETNRVHSFGPVSVWLSNNKQLKSQLVLFYSPELNNTEIECNDKNLSYILSGNC